MVVETDSALAGEEGKAEESPRALPECLIGWNTIHGLPPDAAVSQPPKTPWSMVAIKNHRDHLIFPPINHENLQISPESPPTPPKIPHINADSRQISFSDSDSSSDSDSNSSATFSPAESSPLQRSPLFSVPKARPAADSARWSDLWTKILYSKMSLLVRFLRSSFSSSRGVFVTFRSAFTAILIALLYFRRRRRMRAADESRDRLIEIIKDRDEASSILCSPTVRENAHRNRNSFNSQFCKRESNLFAILAENQSTPGSNITDESGVTETPESSQYPQSIAKFNIMIHQTAKGMVDVVKGYHFASKFQVAAVAIPVGN